VSIRWLWLAYTVASVMQWRRWPLVLGTVPASLLTGMILMAIWS
jgi:hypothetical protein